jgi:uncharacterized LabA/DUF88 family protein
MAAVRFAAFIDAGYLKAAGARALGKRKHEININGTELMAWLRGFRAFDQDDELLRAYWYDAEFEPSHPKYAAQRRFFDVLDSVPGLEVRLGYLAERQPSWHYALRQALKRHNVDLESFGKVFDLKPDLVQKGVDTLITMDLMNHSRSDNYDWALLIAGDRDLLDPVRAVQNNGRRVVLATPNGGSVAPLLRRRADQFVTIDTATLEQFVIPRRVPTTAVA